MLHLERNKLNNQLRINFFNDWRFYKFKKKKWLRVKRNSRQFKYKFIRLNSDLLPNRIRFGRMHWNLLMLKRKLMGFYGLMRISTLRRRIRLKFFKAYAIKKFSYTMKLLKISSYNSNYFIDTLRLFESFLVIILFRANFLKSFNICVQAIRQGLIYVNNKLIVNPWFILKVGDLIRVKVRAKYNFWFLYKKFLYRATHLIVNRRLLFIIYSKIINFYNVEYPLSIYWQLVPFLIYLKR